MLGYLAAATSRVKLGVGVVNPFTRHPALLAMMAATLDRISGGRFVPGHGPQRQFHHPGAAGHVLFPVADQVAGGPDNRP